MTARIGHALGTVVLLVVFATVVAQSSGVITDDVYLQHLSTVAANAGERVQLFARHYRLDNADRGAVIVLSSDALPADAGLGLDYQDYNHLEYLASLGFHVFAADVTGYGLSPMPMMADGCNAEQQVQADLLIPEPLYIFCKPSYPRLLTSLFSDWDEVDTFVEHAREVTGEDRVTLIGWSLGGSRAAGYAALNPDKVERLILIAPRYVRAAPAELPAEHPDGYPLNVHDVDDLVAEWQAAVRCNDWADFGGVSVQLKREVNELDPVAAEWGLLPGDYFRSPGIIWPAGLNSAMVGRISVPTLIVRGLDDTQGADADALYEDLAVDDRLRVDVECGTRWLIWERSRDALRKAIAEFLQAGTVDGQRSGVLLIEARP